MANIAVVKPEKAEKLEVILIQVSRLSRIPLMSLIPSLSLGADADELVRRTRREGSSRGK